MLRSLLISFLLFSGAFAANAQCSVSINQSNVYLCFGQNNTSLQATSGGTSYQWYKNGSPIGTGSDTLQLNGLAVGNHQITVEMTVNTCVTTSSATSVTVLPLPTAVASSNSPCVGATLSLWSNACTGCTFMWNGPNGFTSAFQNPSIPNVQIFNGGVYTLCVSAGGCTACDTVQVNVGTGIPITAGSNGDVCFGDTLELTATTVTGATYQWTGPGNFTSTQQNPIIPVTNTTQGGIYNVAVTQNGCISSDTALASICNTLFLNIYKDINSNCIYDDGLDLHSYIPIMVEIDSNSVPVDTISVTAGLYYTAGGISGDIYTFKLINLGDMVPTCPLTGEVSHTLQPNALNIVQMGIECGNTNGFDFGLYASNPNSSATWQTGHMLLTNSYCDSNNAVVTLVHSPKYQYVTAVPAPSSVTGNTITWNINDLSSDNPLPKVIYYGLYYSTAPLIAGDTTHSYFSITPTTGDANPNNNTWTKVDTVVASYDPNAIMAFPEGCIDAGDQLQYTIMFENIGNAPAENIYVMDTLPQGLDAGSMELVMSSHNMYVTKLYDNGNTIFRFDFPNINLPDSSDHAGCHGMLVYKINSNSSLPLGDSIDHRAGIYFDYNSVVLTNTYRTTICVPNNVSTVKGTHSVLLYPNPAGDELAVQAGKEFTSCTITNSIGQTMLQQELTGPQSRIDIHSLAPGVYYLSVKGEGAGEVLKFVKM